MCCKARSWWGERSGRRAATTHTTPIMLTYPHAPWNQTLPHACYVMSHDGQVQAQSRVAQSRPAGRGACTHCPLAIHTRLQVRVGTEDVTIPVVSTEPGTGASLFQHEAARRSAMHAHSCIAVIASVPLTSACVRRPAWSRHGDRFRVRNRSSSLPRWLMGAQARSKNGSSVAASSGP